MNKEALAFIRILPAGAADIGPDVTRAELREAGAGNWSLACGGRDDLSSVLGPDPRAPEIPPEYDVIVTAHERPPEAGEPVVHLRFGTDG